MLVLNLTIHRKLLTVYFLENVKSKLDKGRVVRAIFLDLKIMDHDSFGSWCSTYKVLNVQFLP